MRRRCCCTGCRANFTTSIASCEVTFTDTSSASAGATITSWLWDFGDGNTSTTQNPTHTFFRNNPTVTLTITDSLGCEATRTLTLDLSGCVPFRCGFCQDDGAVVHGTSDYLPGALVLTVSTRTTGAGGACSPAAVTSAAVAAAVGGTFVLVRGEAPYSSSVEACLYYGPLVYVAEDATYEYYIRWRGQFDNLPWPAGNTNQIGAQLSYLRILKSTGLLSGSWRSASANDLIGFRLTDQTSAASGNIVIDCANVARSGSFAWWLGGFAYSAVNDVDPDALIHSCGGVGGQRAYVTNPSLSFLT